MMEIRVFEAEDKQAIAEYHSNTYFPAVGDTITLTDEDLKVWKCYKVIRRRWIIIDGNSMDALEIFVEGEDDPKH